jgi:nucleoside-diphosphate-sugar epimerase
MSKSTDSLRISAECSTSATASIAGKSNAPEASLPRRVLITGATGFVGRHVAEALSGKTEVRCLVRSVSRAGALLPPDSRLFRGDLESGAGLDAALEGMDGRDCVIHLAAVLFAFSWREYLRGNVAFAARTGEAARRAGVGRVLMVSSLAATGPCGQSPGVEDDSPPNPVSAYGWSKYAAELALARALACGKAEEGSGGRLVVLRPPIIYGPGDRGLLPCFRAAKRGLVVTPGRGRFPLSFVHVHDAVQGVFRCLGPEARGVYHINDGAEHSMESFGAGIAAAFGRKPLVLPVPAPLLALSALAAQCAAKLGLPQGPWNLDKYREARREGWLCSARRIAAELGYAPCVSLREGIARSIEGYRRMKLL